MQNGLLLLVRTFTPCSILGLIGVKPDTLTVVIAEGLKATVYRDFAGVRLREPIDPMYRPSVTALHEHIAWSRLYL